MEKDLKPSARADEDKALVARVIDGDGKAFENLMQKYRKSVYYLVFKIVRNAEDAEDLTQDTFVKAYSFIHKFDSKFAFSTWLFKIATNNCIDFIRRRKMQTLPLNAPQNPNDASSPVLQLQDRGPIPSDSLVLKERREHLMFAIDRLPERYRKLLHLRYFDELSYEEVAQRLGVPMGTIKAQLHRARELLFSEMAALQKKL
ncbi:MAG: sigma-70 family RNA polymerase sigma factor [Bacteroidia bacterium]|nr:sigma-70 family RNA polymerase sigma factor [Bacteroidia bacterium]MDW8333209.1 sigma-70 family RNA polymerase sigma factor [Bacteroidia bacterium]